MGAKKTSKAWIGWVISGVFVLGVAGNALPIDNQTKNQTNSNNYINTYYENTLNVEENLSTHYIENKSNEADEKTSISLSEIPAYSGNPYVEINNNNPFFSNSDLITSSYEKYSSLDSLRKMWSGD